MKQKYLTVYDYGTGGVWAFILAESPREIVERYPELTVVSEIPGWMTGHHRRTIEEKETYDIDAVPSGLLADLLNARKRKG
ncbi:MAG TPA: hypothetical protein VFT98_03270 [Myxococcota bacterium]|nr:hypothetical protein [Myxococcota bacterium]